MWSVCAQLLSFVQLFAIPCTVACQASLSMKFPRQEYWSGLPFPPLGDLPNPGIEPASPALQAYSLPPHHLGSPQLMWFYGFSSSHVQLWELDHKEGWAPKIWCFWTVVLEETLESPLDCKEIQPVHPKGNQSWIFIGRTDAEAEAPILWPPDVKSQLTGKDPGAGKDGKHKGRLKAGGEVGDRGCDGWMASLIQWA